MDDTREEILDVLCNDFVANNEESMLFEYLQERGERDLRVCAKRMLKEGELDSLTRELMRVISINPKLKLLDVARILGVGKSAAATSLIKTNKQLREQLRNYSDGTEKFSSSQVKELLELILPKLPRPSKSLSLMMEREQFESDESDYERIQAAIVRELKNEARQWLLDRGYPISGRRDASIRVWDIPVDLVALVLARHKEIALDDDDFDAAAAHILAKQMFKQKRAGLVPIRVQRNTGAALLMAFNKDGRAAFVTTRVLGDKLISFFDKVPSEEKIAAQLEFADKLEQYRSANGKVPKGCPDRYRMFFSEHAEHLHKPDLAAARKREDAALAARAKTRQARS